MELLAGSPLLAIMVVVALGAAVGMIPFGPIRFGAAGALFVGLAVGSVVPGVGQGLAGVQQLGLGLFVYMVGLAAGETFFADLRRQLPLLSLAVVTALLAFATAVAVGTGLGLDAGFIAGTFAGALTSTPALAAATASTGSPNAAVGYSIGYPVGVVLAIIAVGALVTRTWPEAKDPRSAAAEGIVATSTHVEREASLREVPGWSDETIKMSYLVRGGRTRVLAPGELLQPDDLVLVVGAPAAVDAAVAFLGQASEGTLTDDRQDVDFRRFLVSDPSVAGRTVASLNLPSRHGGVLTRVLRGDTDLLARDDLVLQLGDRVLAVVPRSEMDAVARHLGDSERKVSEVDALALGLGLSLGLLLGAVSIPLGGGAHFSLGSAAGPLVVGMVLGALHRTGPLNWEVPLSANLTIRQLGLLLFLAAVGLASGPAFAASAFSPTGLRAGAVGVAVVGISAAAFAIGGRVLGLSAPRTAGGLAGFVGQPAVLTYATSRLDDERIENGYAALFALGIIVKILLVQVFGGVL